MTVQSQRPRQFQQQEKPAPSSGGVTLWLNLLGILSAFVIAVGGLFLVQGSLTMEEKRFLSGGGLVELYRAGTVETAEGKDISVPRPLTEEELVQIIRALEKGGEIRPHEPGQEQLSMIEAMECSRAWMEDFLMPHLGVSDLNLQEYKVSCYLWMPETEGADAEESPWLSCWTISFSNQSMETRLILNAVSGQVLDASVSCALPVEYQDREHLMTFLGDYAFSFGLTEDYTLVYSGETESGAKKLPWYQSIGTQGIFAVIDADSIAVSLADEDAYTEFFNIHVYLKYFTT